MNGNKYQSTIKIEFRDLIKRLLESERKSFHMYTIHRILSLGLLIEFSFQYRELEDPNTIGIELDLKEYGKVLFVVDIKSSYVEIASEGHKQMLQQFVEEFDVYLEKKSKSKRIF